MSEARSKYRVMIVDDDKAEANILTQAFHRCGDFFDCEHIDNGTMAFERLVGCKTGVTDERPDLIVLDLDLPGMRGEQLMAFCRLSSDMEHVPVVVFSGNIEGEADMRGQFSEGVHALAKPDDWTSYREAAFTILRIAAQHAGAPRLNA
jgi:CheY-like chemotaxis protein